MARVGARPKAAVSTTCVASVSSANQTISDTSTSVPATRRAVAP